MIPTSMKALVLSRYLESFDEVDAYLSVEERPLRPLKWGEVLVKMKYAPCNPSDEMFLKGRYGVRKDLPAVPGWEGAGEVVAHGGGVLGRGLIGKRVACGGQGGGDGTWAQYFIARATMCFPLPEELPWEQGATLLVNPLTVLAMLDTIRKGRHGAVIHTAAASQVGQMLLPLSKEQGIPLINIVKREDQADLLAKRGAEYILLSESPTFRDDLRELSVRLNATAAFDAIAGSMTGTLLDCMPSHSTVLVYGALSEESCEGIDPRDLIFKDKSVSGFYLADWIEELSLLRRLRVFHRLRSLTKKGYLRTNVGMCLTPEQLVDELGYSRSVTNAKTLVSLEFDG